MITNKQQFISTAPPQTKERQMILNKLEDFTNAILRGEEINHETVFYTGILDDVTENGSDNKSPHPQIGDLYKDVLLIDNILILINKLKAIFIIAKILPKQRQKPPEKFFKLD